MEKVLQRWERLTAEHSSKTPESFMPKKRKFTKPDACSSCAGTDLVRRITTYPVMLTGQLEGKQVDIGRVPLYECKACGHQMPTRRGQTKVDDLVPKAVNMFLGSLP